jgi:ABC-type cobalamin/Fe3+-siderophores transport system ATPase subunit
MLSLQRKKSEFITVAAHGLQLHAGDRVAIIGQTGAGKSILVKGMPGMLYHTKYNDMTVMVNEKKIDHGFLALKNKIQISTKGATGDFSASVKEIIVHNGAPLNDGAQSSLLRIVIYSIPHIKFYRLKILFFLLFFLSRKTFYILSHQDQKKYNHHLFHHL